MSSRVFVPEAEEPESAKIEGGVPAESGGDGEVQFGEVEVGGDAEEAGDGRVEGFAEGYFEEVVGGGGMRWFEVVPWWYSEMCGEAGYEFGGDWISISDFASRTYVGLLANRTTCQVLSR